MYANRISKKSAERARDTKMPAAIEYLLVLIEKLLSLRISPLAKGVIRVGVSVLCVLGFVGVIGGIESGAISFSWGIMAGIALTFTEILALKE